MASVELCFDTSLGPCEIQMVRLSIQRAEAFAWSNFSQPVVLDEHKFPHPFDANPIVLVYCGW